MQLIPLPGIATPITLITFIMPGHPTLQHPKVMLVHDLCGTVIVPKVTVLPLLQSTSGGRPALARFTDKSASPVLHTCNVYVIGALVVMGGKRTWLSLAFPSESSGEFNVMLQLMPMGITVLVALLVALVVMALPFVSEPPVPVAVTVLGVVDPADEAGLPKDML